MSREEAAMVDYDFGLCSNQIELQSKNLSCRVALIEPFPGNMIFVSDINQKLIDALFCRELEQVL